MPLDHQLYEIKKPARSIASSPTEISSKPFAAAVARLGGAGPAGRLTATQLARVCRALRRISIGS